MEKVFIRDTEGQRRSVIEYSNPNNMHNNFLDMSKELKEKQDYMAKALAKDWFNKLGRQIVYQQ